MPLAIGYYTVAIQIEDFAYSTDTVPLSSIPLQFLVNSVNISNCTQEPVIVDATLPNNAFLNISVGNSMSWFITAQTRNSKYVSKNDECAIIW